MSIGGCIIDWSIKIIHPKSSEQKIQKYELLFISVKLDLPVYVY